MNETVDRVVVILLTLAVVVWFGYKALEPVDVPRPPEPAVYQHPEYKEEP